MTKICICKGKQRINIALLLTNLYTLAILSRSCVTTCYYEEISGPQIMKVQELETRNPKRLVYRVIYAQLLLTLVMAAIIWSIMDLRAAYSAIVAGAICALANWFFAWRVFRYQGARVAKQFVIAFCLGEFMKLFILGLLFILAILLLKIAIGPFLISFIINLMIYWIAPFIIFGFE